MTIKLFITLTILAITGSPELIFNFTKDSQNNSWNVVDDGVMGGKSKGHFFINELGHGVFHGDISLENNGGFSMIVHRTSLVSISSNNTVVLRLKGDQKTYQLRVKDKADRYYTYTKTFETSGMWEEIKIPLNTMSPSFRGRAVNQPNFDQTTIDEIAILIGNKKAESFRIQLDKITLQ